MAVEIIALDARRFGEWRAPVFETFRAGFAMSGEDAARFAERVVDRHAGRASFRCVLAREGVDGSFLGCAYGYTGGPGQWWRDIVAGAVGGGPPSAGWPTTSSSSSSPWSPKPGGAASAGSSTTRC